MREVTNLVIAWVHERQNLDDGQGMIEYALLVALISIVAIAVITLIGTGLTANFQSVLNAL